MEAWNNFKGENWKRKIDVEDFILNNYEEYIGDESFLSKPTAATKKLLNIVTELQKEELKKGILDIDVDHVSGVNNNEV